MREGCHFSAALSSFPKPAFEYARYCLEALPLYSPRPAKPPAYASVDIFTSMSGAQHGFGSAIFGYARGRQGNLPPVAAVPPVSCVRPLTLEGRAYGSMLRLVAATFRRFPRSQGIAQKGLYLYRKYPRRPGQDRMLCFSVFHSMIISEVALKIHELALPACSIL